MLLILLAYLDFQQHICNKRKRSARFLFRSARALCFLLLSFDHFQSGFAKNLKTANTENMNKAKTKRLQFFQLGLFRNYLCPKMRANAFGNKQMWLMSRLFVQCSYS